MTNLTDFHLAYWQAADFTNETEETLWSEQAMSKSLEDCEAFLNATAHLDYISDNYSAAQAGHDFWLTRNGHGAGFWCRPNLSTTLGEKLTEIASAMGECHIYTGDDNLIYLT